MSTQTRANDQKLDCNSLLTLLGGSWANGPGPLYRRLADRLDVLIESSELRDGAALPAERMIASALGVSRSTVVNTLDLLRERGSVVSRQGSGTRVQGPTPLVQDQAHFQSRSLFQNDGQLIDLVKACPGMLDGVKEMYRSFLSSDAELDHSMDPQGIVALRQALAQRYTDHGLRTNAGDMIITSGAQQGMGIVLSVLARPGDVVLVESSTWPGLTDSIRRLGARPIGVRMDQQGVDTAELRSAVERFRPAAIALNPYHHNPTATRLSPARRSEVARISADYRVPVIEDRVTALLSFDGVVSKPLAQERPDAPIITVDSLSKVLWPGMRLGWVRANPAILGELRLAKAIADLWTSTLSQALGLLFLDQLDNLLPVRTAQLKSTMEFAVEMLAKEVPDWQVQAPPGGMVIWAQLPQPFAAQLAHHAATHGVRIAGADAFCIDGTIDNRVRVPYTDSPEVLGEGIQRLAAAWRTLDPERPLPRPPESDLVF